MPDRDRSSFPNSFFNFKAESGFPIFPEDFSADTVYLQQALADYNSKRVSLGLSPQDYFHLCDEDRHEIIRCANNLKFADQGRLLQMGDGRFRVRVRDKVRAGGSGHQLTEEERNELREASMKSSRAEELKALFSNIGFYLLLLGAIGLASLLWRIL
jgi:hypothetical protein